MIEVRIGWSVEMETKQLTIERLLNAGFEQVGCWELTDTGFLLAPALLPAKAAVYAFAIDGIVQYVGIAAKSLVRRFRSYQKPGPTQRTSIRLNEIIRALATSGTTIQILVAYPPDHEWNGMRISGLEGLEAGLISDFDLPWNIRGSTRPGPASVPEIACADAGAAGFYVYENWVRDKAIVHRSDCSFCNHGSGLHGSRTTKSSTWHGPYQSSDGALARAKECRRTRTEGCAICSPL